MTNDAEPEWLEYETIVRAHARQIAEHGGGEGIRDDGLLRSALQRPLDKFHHDGCDIAECAAAYSFGLAKNHAFVDGNKRVALVAARTFLLLNGYQVTAAPIDRLRMFIALAAGEISEEQLAAWFRANTAPITG